MTDHRTPPDWITDYATSVRDLLGLGEWRIFLKMVDTAGSAEFDASTTLDTRYLKAYTNLCHSIVDDQDKARRVVMHESLHVALAHIDQAVRRIIELLPDELQAHANQLYTDSEEASIERLVRSFEVALRPREDTHAADG